jgi:hypothetical protein
MDKCSCHDTEQLFGCVLFNALQDETAKIAAIEATKYTPYSDGLSKRSHNIWGMM